MHRTMVFDTDNTPQLNNRVIEQVFVDEAANERKNVWKSCCFEVDRRFVKFIIQVLITFLILVFSLIKIIADPSCEASNTYTSIISGILGFWLPQPTL